MLERSLLAAALVAVACSGAAQTGVQADCGEDKDCLRQLLSTHPVKDVGTLRAFQSIPFDRRVVVAPAKLIDYLNLDNRLNDFPNRPRTARPEQKFLQDMQNALKGIPTGVKTLVDSRLLGIFLVQDLGGTGYTDYVYDARHEPVGAFVVLDIAVLTRSANDWATWKENTPFIQDPGIELQAVIEDEAGDNRKQALQYILLHELGHVASVGRNFHPPWDSWDCVQDPPSGYPFFQLSWQLQDQLEGRQDCKVRSKFDDSAFGSRPDVVYYFGAKLPVADSPAVYAQLAQTNFPSLYAATSPGDDFAESFVSYVHTVLMASPFEMRIEQGGKRLISFTGCWGTERCAEKQKMMADLFAVPD